MTPAEKWQRLSNPQTVEDYGLSMTTEDLRAVPEAQQEILSYLPLQHQDIFNQGEQA